MTSTSELIARADQVAAECEVRENHPDDCCPDFTAMLRECEANLRLAARAEVDVLEQRDRDIGILLANIRFLENTVGEWLEDDDASMVRQIEREHKERATPPAQPAPVSGESSTSSDGGSMEQPFALADAVRETPAPRASSGKQEGRTGSEVGAKKIAGSSMSCGPDKPIIAGQAPSPSESTHGKPDGAVREAILEIVDSFVTAITPKVQSILIDHLSVDALEMNIDGIGSATEAIMGEFSDGMEAALHSPKIAAAETSPGDVTDEPTYYTEGRDAVWFEGLTDAEFAWRIERAAQDLADSDIGSVEQWMPIVGIVANAGERIKRLAAIDRLDVKAEAKSQEPEAVAFGMYDTQMGRSARLMMVRLCNGQDGCDVPLYTHPTTKPEAPAVGVDAIKAALEPLARIARLLDQDREQPGHDDEAIFKLRGYKAVSITIGDCRKATAIAALIAGER
jgi:hypothetical protein